MSRSLKKRYASETRFIPGLTMGDDHLVRGQQGDVPAPARRPVPFPSPVDKPWLINRMRGKATIRMTTDEMMALTRGEE